MGLKGSDYALRGSVPQWLPLSVRRWARDLTYNEVHAMALGLLGLPLALAWTTAGAVGELAVSLVGVLLAGIVLLRLPREQGMAARLLSREPWYFATVFVVATLSGGLVTVMLA